MKIDCQLSQTTQIQQRRRDQMIATTTQQKKTKTKKIKSIANNIDRPIRFQRNKQKQNNAFIEVGHKIIISVSQNYLPKQTKVAESFEYTD